MMIRPSESARKLAEYRKQHSDTDPDYNVWQIGEDFGRVTLMNSESPSGGYRRFKNSITVLLPNRQGGQLGVTVEYKNHPEDLELASEMVRSIRWDRAWTR